MAEKWTRDSWRKLPIRQVPEYGDAAKLEGLDAEMRLLEAELLMRLEHRSDAERVLDEVDRRFAHRSDLVVNYPVGKQSSLTEAVRIARAPRWWAF